MSGLFGSGTFYPYFVGCVDDEGQQYSRGQYRRTARNVGSGCAINVRWDLATYRYGGGTFSTRSLQLDHVTEFLYDSESRIIYAGDSFEYVGYGLYATA